MNKTSKKRVAVKKTAVKKPVKASVVHRPAAAALFVEEKYAPKKLRRKLRPGKRVRPDFKRVPPTIVKRPSPAQLEANEEFIPVDTAKAVQFGAAIAKLMKRSAAKESERMEKHAAENNIRLGKRPTTRANGRNTPKFPIADLKEFRKRLLAARDQARLGVDAMKATGFNESDDHEIDGGDGTAQTLRLQALGQMGNINRTLQKIEEALHRIDDGTYGVCAACGQLIRKPRLLNQPFVLTCMECQSAMERGQR